MPVSLLAYFTISFDASNADTSYPILRKAKLSRPEPQPASKTLAFLGK